MPGLTNVNERVHAIFNRTASSAPFSSNSAKLNRTIATSGAKLATGEGFINRQEADKAGITSALDKARNDMINVVRYQFNTITAKSRLQEQETVLADFGAIIADFNGGANMANLNQLNLTPAQYADQFLDRVQALLDKTGFDGYMLGGRESKQSPVLHELKTNSNLINDVPTSNYTTALPDESTIDVAQGTSVPLNILSADDRLVVKFIGALNLYKNEGNPTPSAAVAGLIAEAEAGGDQSFFDIRNALDTINDAETKNVNQKTVILGTLNIKNTDILVEQDLLTTALQTISIMFTILNAQNNLTNTLTSALSA